MKKTALALSVLLVGMNAFAAPRCLDLTKKQAEKAVRVAKIAMNKGSSLLFVSSKESGLVKPLGIWTEQVSHKAKGKKAKRATSYRVFVDGRQVDLALVYVAKNPDQSKAKNLGRLAGCQKAFAKPAMVDNVAIVAAPDEISEE